VSNSGRAAAFPEPPARAPPAVSGTPIVGAYVSLVDAELVSWPLATVALNNAEATSAVTRRLITPAPRNMEKPLISGARSPNARLAQLPTRSERYRCQAPAASRDALRRPLRIARAPIPVPTR